MHLVRIMAMALLLAGCRSYSETEMSTPVKETVYRFPAQAAGSALTPTETQGIDALLAAIPPASVRMATIAPGRYDEPAKMEALQYYLMQRGFASEDIRVYGALAQPVMTLSVRYRVYPQMADCGAWADEGDFNENNRLASQMGCSYAVNLRAMVARPADLLEPRSDPRAQTETAVRAIGVYNGTVEPTVTAEDILKAAYEARTTDED